MSRAKEYCKAKGKNLKIELEVRNFDELNQALAEGVDRIMFDNFTPEDTRKAVEIVGGRCETESSGGITYDSMLPYAQAESYQTNRYGDCILLLSLQPSSP